MGTIDNAAAWWPLGAPEPPAGGLFDVVPLVQPGDPHVFLGAQHWSNRCTPGGVWLDMCDPQTAKTFRAPELVQGYPFAVYDGMECTIGASADDLAGMLLDTFAVKAEAVAEARLQDALAPAPAATSLPAAVADLEVLLAAGYAGRGLLHMDRGTAVHAFMENLLVPSSDGAGVRTINGTPVVLGRGYTAAPGGFFTAATGQVVALAGPVQQVRTPITGTEPGRVLVEQQFVLLVECVATSVEGPL
jgi:hypothetical protein